MAKNDKDRGEGQRQLAPKRERSSLADPSRRNTSPDGSPTSHLRGLEGLIWHAGTPLGPPKGFSGRGFQQPTGPTGDPEGFERDGNPEATVEEGVSDGSTKASRPGGPGRLESPEGTDQGDHAAGGIADWHEEDARGPGQWDDRGFSQDGFHRDTGTGFDPGGFDVQGFDFDGYDRKGYDSLGYDREGYDREGYDFQGYNRRGSRGRN